MPSSFKLLFLFFLTQAHSEPFELGLGPYYEVQSDCYVNTHAQQCQPAFINVAYNNLFHTTNTCRDGEHFCIQTGNTGSLCDVCRRDLYHVRHLTDPRNNTWWQSSTMLEGLQHPASVNLTLDLGKSYHITYVRLKFQSLRPESFAIYKKNELNGPWIPFQYYSSSCYDTYGIRANETLRKGREDVAICDSRQTDTLPTSGGTVAFSTLQGRPGASSFKHNLALQNWVTAREIKIVLNRMNSFGDEIFEDPNVLRSYFYAISDIAIGGRCNCNGHASSCDEGRCRCEHHTTGVDCEQCLPLYNVKAWGKATMEDANECSKCNCNGLSSKCYFDQDLYRNTGDGGHCIECADNRFGAQCSLCAEGFYTFHPGDRCVPCGCDHMGSRDQQCDNRGVCACKEGVGGEKCDRCLPNFFDLSQHGCRACECSVAGSVRNVPECVEGRCRCKENVIGDNCNMCKKGYYGLNPEDPLGCVPCHCSGHSTTCQTSPGYHISTIYTDFAHGDGRWKGLAEDGRSAPVLVRGQSIEVPSSRNSYLLAPVEYLNDKRLSYNLDISFTLRDSHEHPPSHHDVIIESTNGRSVSTSFTSQENPTPSASSQSYRFKLNENRFYGWMPVMSHVEFVAILSDVVAIKIRAHGQISSFKLHTSAQGYGPQDAMNVERCECPEGYVGQFCESCSPGYRRHGGMADATFPCVRCQCNGHSDVCDPTSGRCICSHNTVGESCERCAPGYHGNALHGRPDDCRVCPCPNRGQCEEMSSGEVVCKDCMPGYAGNRCNECADGYYGNAQEGRGGCQKCNCNGNIDPNMPGNCDKWTGECLKCTYNTAGPNCDRCLPNHHGNPLALPRGQCKPCDCYEAGSVVDERGDYCNTYTGQCMCKPNVVCAKCNKCSDGFWNIDSPYGCERCECDREGSIETSCNGNTGECKCKAGVGGNRCDTCLPDHYGFSQIGCTACECNPEGSLSSQCDAYTGRCECRENIEGKTCDRCSQNKFLDRNGACVECPECYRLVQGLGDELKQKLIEMKVFLNYLLHDHSHRDNHQFVSSMHQVNSSLVHLWTRITRFRGGHSGGAPTDDMTTLKRTLYESIRSVHTVHFSIESSGMKCKSGETDLLATISLINNIERMTSSTEKKTKREGLVALRKVYEVQKEHGSRSQTLTRMAHQARKIIRDLEMTSASITKVTNDALRMSEEALRLAQQSQATPGSVVREINKIKQKLTHLHQEHQKTSAAAEASSHEARKAHDHALNLLTSLNSLRLPPLPNDDASIESSLERTRTQAERLERQVADIFSKNTRIINDLKYRLRMARDTYTGALREQQTLEELLAESDSARMKAMRAVEGASGAYRKAQEDLKTLQQFDDKVRKSKRLSQEALHKKDKIMAGIKEAEDMTKRANRNLANADMDAVNSKRAIDEATKTIEDAFKLLKEMSSKTSVTKEELLQFNKQSVKFKIQLKEITASMDEVSRVIDEDEERIQIAKEDTDIARAGTTYSLDSLTQYQNKFNQMIEELGQIEEYDPIRVETLERKLVNLERLYGGENVFAQIQEMRNINLRMNIVMDDHESHMGQLYLDVENIKAINSSIPRTCFKILNLEPTDPRLFE